MIHLDHDSIEDLAHAPTGGRVTRWLAGTLIPACIIIYGLVCIRHGSTTMLGRGASLELRHEPAFWMAVAYIAIGGFLHFHFLWGSIERLLRFSHPLKVLSLLVFVSSFIYSLCLQFYIL